MRWWMNRWWTTQWAISVVFTAIIPISLEQENECFFPKYKMILSSREWEFPGSPVVRTHCFHCWGPGFNPCSGSQVPTNHAEQPGKKKKNSRKRTCQLTIENWAQNRSVYMRTLRHKENRLPLKTWPNLPHRLWACPALRTSLLRPHHSRLPVVSWEDHTPAKSPSMCQHVGSNDYFPPVNISWWVKALFLAKTYCSKKFFFLPISLRYNLQAAPCKFKVDSIVIHHEMMTTVSLVITSHLI